MGSSFERKYNQKLTTLPYTLNGTNDSEIWRGIARVWPHLLHGFSWPVRKGKVFVSVKID